MAAAPVFHILGIIRERIIMQHAYALAEVCMLLCAFCADELQHGQVVPLWCVLHHIIPTPRGFPMVTHLIRLVSCKYDGSRDCTPATTCSRGGVHIYMARPVLFVLTRAKQT